MQVAEKITLVADRIGHHEQTLREDAMILETFAKSFRDEDVCDMAKAPQMIGPKELTRVLAGRDEKR